MVSKKKTPVKENVGKSKLKKETIRDLDARRRASDVKGGYPDQHEKTESCKIAC